MATYNLAFPDVAIDAILTTAYHLQQVGYIFRGSASDYSGTPTEREWVIAPAGFSGLGLSSAVPKGSIGVCLYNGTAWVGKVINVVTIDSSVSGSSNNAVSSSAVYAAINQLATGVAEALDNLTFTDTTPSAFLGEYITEKVSTTDGGIERILTYFTILAATTSKAGLLSAADKAKLDAILGNLRSLKIDDTTAYADLGDKIVESIKATIGGTEETISTFQLLAATASKAGLLSAADKAKLDALWSSGYQFVGIATPTTTPISTTSKIFYIATQAGTYFNSVTVTQGINILSWNGTSWSAVQVVSFDGNPKPSSKGLVYGYDSYNHRAEISIIEGYGYPFEIGTYEGASAGPIRYVENNKRVRVELPTRNISKIKAKSGYRIVAALYEDYIPTMNVYSIAGDFTSQTLNIQSAIENVSGWNPNRVIIAIKNESETTMDNVTSVDDLINITPVTYNLLELSQNANSHPKYCFSLGNITYGVRSVNFGAGSSIAIQQNNQTNLNISFSEDVTYTFSTANRFLIVRNGELVMTGSSDDILLSDIVLFVYSPTKNAITGGELYADYLNYNKIQTKDFNTVQGALSRLTGLYPSETQYLTASYCHTPKYIKMNGDMRILNQNVSGRVIFYKSDQTFNRSVLLSDYQDGIIVKRNASDAYVRFTFNQDNDAVLPERLMIEGIWETEIDRYEPIPADEGFQNLAFPVNICDIPNPSGLSINPINARSLNYGVLHLPESYSPIGEGTPLILYLHGAAERYNINSVRFGENVRYSPEWSAAGYAQMDVDMIPSLYGYNGTGSSGTGDDTACVYAAYQWVIEHYNIRRDGVYLFGRSRGGQAVLSILARYNPDKMPVVCALSNSGANSMILYSLFRSKLSLWWSAFVKSMGMTNLNPPTFDSTKVAIEQPDIVAWLRTNIDYWWKKSMTALGMIRMNPTQYQTPTEIFDLLVESYNQSDAGKTFIEDFIERCSFHSPVPLRFDWCKGDNTQPWDATPYGNYGSAGKNAFVNSLMGNSIYREWPSCPSNAHYHEKYNLYDGDYTLPNGDVVEDPSMAMVEWLLWAQSHDQRNLNGVYYQ